MKSKLDFLKEQEIHQVYIGGIVYEMVKVSQAEIAMENYTKQKLNIHSVMQAACQHEIVDARNAVISSGYMCVKCNAVFKAAAVGNSAAGQNGSVVEYCKCGEYMMTVHAPCPCERKD